MDQLNYSFGEQKIFWKQTYFNIQKLSYAEKSAGLIKLITQEKRLDGTSFNNACI